MPDYKKLSIYSVLFLLLYLSIFCYMLNLEVHHRDTNIWGIDFAAYYATGQMIINGHSEDIYNYDIHQKETFQVLNRVNETDNGWYYPPTFLLFIVPLAYLPYHAALALWLAMSFMLALYAVYLLVPNYRGIALYFCGFPAVLWNLRWGQNGFLSTGLLGFGIFFVDANPILSGLMFGLLTYKPQMAFFPLLLLLFAKKWKVIFWSAASAVGAAVLSGLLFGFNIWISFLELLPSLSENRSMFLAQFGEHMHLTPYSYIEKMGLEKSVSYLLLGLIIILVVTIAAWIWNRTDSLALRGSVLVLGIPLSMPYFIQYDLVILALPLVLLSYDCLERGYRKAEIAILISLWFMTLINWHLAHIINIQICQYVLFAVLGLIIYRVIKHNHDNMETATSGKLSKGLHECILNSTLGR